MDKSYFICTDYCSCYTWFIFEPMIVPTGSMIHTIEINDRILVNKFIYRFQIPITMTL